MKNIIYNLDSIIEAMYIENDLVGLQIIKRLLEDETLQGITDNELYNLLDEIEENITLINQEMIASEEDQS